MTPIVAVVGRPNVGKSTLVNRIVGGRQAVVQNTPGVTRDRVPYDASWSGRTFTLVDTGGWEPDATGRAAAIATQAEYAMRSADVVLLVVDATVGATEADLAAARVLQRGKARAIVVANKVDSERVESDVATLWSLGLGQPYPISALHGRGSGDLLDAVVGILPNISEEPPETRGPRRVALLGRPNVGKSSLLNALTGEDRAVVDPVAGTTVDPVDSLVEIDGELWRFVDTAGLRRKGRHSQGIEYYATLRTSAALESAEVAIVLLDAADSIADQDMRIIEQVNEAGRALVIVFNKWDLVDDERRWDLEREISQRLSNIAWAPRVNISALTRRSVGKLATALRTSLRGWEQRISTAQLNSWLADVYAAHPHPIRGGKQPRILFGTQADACPPRFILFTTSFLEEQYRRFLERRLREDFGFEGTPIHISMKIREKRGRGNR